MKKTLIIIYFSLFCMAIHGNAEEKICEQGSKYVETAVGLFKKQDAPDYPTIIGLFKKAKAECPNWSVPSRYLGDIMAEQKKYEDATDYYLQAIQIDNQDFEACLYLGDVYRKMKQPVHALRYYYKGINILESSNELKSANLNLYNEYVAVRSELEKKSLYKDETEIIKHLNKASAFRIGVSPKIETHIEFDVARNTIKADCKAQLDTISEVMKKDEMKPYRFIIQGHTDPKGSYNFNQKLSEKRAESVRAYLIKQGVLACSLESEGKGESNLLEHENGEPEKSWYQRCRRVVFISCDKDDTKAECLKKTESD